MSDMVKSETKIYFAFYIYVHLLCIYI